MQFGGQHPGGIGVPAVGMAFPGYVAQSQLGMGNSEMTWYGFILVVIFFLEDVILHVINASCSGLVMLLILQYFGN